MERPTQWYALPPKPEWFMEHSSQLSNVALHKEVDVVVGGKKNLLNTHFTKMTSEQYDAYLSAHKKWQAEAIETDQKLHMVSLQKRAYESFKEPVSVLSVDTVPEPRMILRNPFADRQTPAIGNRNPMSYNDFELTTLPEKKERHEPILSTKPHRAEKRQAKKELVNAKVKTAAVLLEHRTKVETEVREDRKQVISDVEKQKAQAPLHRQTLKTAKALASEVLQIKKSSPDYVGNAISDEGWKVVTRKKGSYIPVTGEINVTNADGTTKTVSVSKDPTASYKSVLQQAVREPISISTPVTLQ